MTLDRRSPFVKAWGDVVPLLVPRCRCISALATIAPATLHRLSASNNAIVDLSPFAGHTQLLQADLSNNKIMTLDPILGAPWWASGCPSWQLVGNPLDPQTVTIALPTLCDNNKISVTWDGGGCFTCDVN